MEVADFIREVREEATAISQKLHDNGEFFTEEQAKAAAFDAVAERYESAEPQFVLVEYD